MYHGFSFFINLSCGWKVSKGHATCQSLWCFHPRLSYSSEFNLINALFDCLDGAVGTCQRIVKIFWACLSLRAVILVHLQWLLWVGVYVGLAEEYTVLSTTINWGNMSSPRLFVLICSIVSSSSPPLLHSISPFHSRSPLFGRVGPRNRQQPSNGVTFPASVFSPCSRIFH